MRRINRPQHLKPNDLIEDFETKLGIILKAEPYGDFCNMQNVSRERLIVWRAEVLDVYTGRVFAAPLANDEFTILVEEAVAKEQDSSLQRKLACDIMPGDIILREGRNELVLSVEPWLVSESHPSITAVEVFDIERGPTSTKTRFFTSSLEITVIPGEGKNDA